MRADSDEKAVAALAAKIAAIRAKTVARGATPAEARAARKTAEKLIRRYNLTASKISEAKPEKVASWLDEYAEGLTPLQRTAHLWALRFLYALLWTYKWTFNAVLPGFLGLILLIVIVAWVVQLF